MQYIYYTYFNVDWNICFSSDITVFDSFCIAERQSTVDTVMLPFLTQKVYFKVFAPNVVVKREIII